SSYQRLSGGLHEQVTLRGRTIVTYCGANLMDAGCGPGDRGISMLAIIIAAVLGAAVGALTTASLKWGRAALAVVMARMRRDHRTLHGGDAWSLPQSVSAGAQCSVRVLVACAPSRSIRESSIDPDRAIPFIRENFPGMFPDEPSLSLPH